MTARNDTTQRTLPDAAKLRMRDWLGTQTDSAAKRLAADVARTWDTEGEAAAKALFQRESDSQKLVRWVQIAVCDMTAAFRANPDLYEVPK